MSTSYQSKVLTLIAVLVLLLTGSCGDGVPQSVDESTTSPPVAGKSSETRLSSDLLRCTVKALQAGETPPEGVEVIDGRVRVEVVHDTDGRSVRRIVEAVGGIIEGTSPGIVQALIPFEELETLEGNEAVDVIRVPLRVDIVPGA